MPRSRDVAIREILGLARSHERWPVQEGVADEIRFAVGLLTGAADDDDPARIEYRPPQPTLRDRFAMAALSGSLAGDCEEKLGRSHEDEARDAYAYADAMLAARERKGGDGQ